MERILHTVTEVDNVSHVTADITAFFCITVITIYHFCDRLVQCSELLLSIGDHFADGSVFIGYFLVGSFHFRRKYL